MTDVETKIYNACLKSLSSMGIEKVKKMSWFGKNHPNMDMNQRQPVMKWVFKLMCKCGLHRWRDCETDLPYVSPEVCIDCGAKRSENPMP